MQDWKVLLTDGLEQTGQELLRRDCQVDNREGISADDLLDVVGQYEAIIVRGRTKVTAQVLQAGKKLRVIGRAGVGVDNIDLAAATRQPVTVVNSPLATTQAVAEYTLGLILALARSLPRADATMKAGLWLKKEFLGIEVYGRILGVIGMGQIGRAVSRKAAAMGMQILGYDPLIPGDEIAHCGAEPVGLAEVYQRSDFISVHVPLTPETKGLLTGQSFAQMKRGVRLVCTARGHILDETTLLGALETGQVAGAALDVFASEPPGLTGLVSHPNVIATPHIAAQTLEAQSRAAEDIAREVLAALRGAPLHWRIV